MAGELPQATLPADYGSSVSDMEDDESFTQESPIDPKTNDSLEFALRNSNLSNSAVAAFVRWHQLEDWLRQLSYVELRSQFGAKWESKLGAGSLTRMENDRAYRYMATPDLENPLAYLDAGKLFSLIEDNWNLFDSVLIDREIWNGRRAELVKIRHRIGHMRRPHEDDVKRLEQTLRDLEGGAFAALASYNEQYSPTGIDEENAVVAGWMRKKHPMARLIDHSERTRDISFSLTVVRRPWAEIDFPKTGQEEGFLWRIDFYLPTRRLRLFDLWRDAGVVKDVRPLLLFLHSEIGQLTVTFPMVDDSEQIADAIGQVFESVHQNSPLAPASEEDFHLRFNTGHRGNTNHDFRILLASPWSTIDSSTVPVTLFGARDT